MREERGYPIDEDGYDTEESVQMDILLEEWERFLDETMTPFDLVPRDFHGVLDEKILKAVMHPGFMGNVKSAIEHEYPDLRDLYAEQFYTKYSTSLYHFFEKMFPDKSRGKTIDGQVFRVKKDPRAEIGQNDKYFWEAFMRRADKAAVENIWDLFDYQVALVYYGVFPFHYIPEVFRGKTFFTIEKNQMYNQFTSIPIVNEAGALAEKISSGRFDHEGSGFVAIFVNGGDIIRSITSGVDVISADSVYVGIHDWSTGAGTVQIIKKEVSFPISNATIDDDPEFGLMRHRAGARPRHERKKVV